MTIVTNQLIYSVVVPCFNEAAGIEDFHGRLSQVMNGLGGAWEVVYVNDGSEDTTLERLASLRERDRNVGLVNLSRNFGKEIALTAGLDHARGQAIVVIDADLQDPPEVIPELVAMWKKGFDSVYAQRRERDGDSWLKKVTASGFYWVMANIGGDVRLPRDVGDFRLLSRRAADSLLQLRERHRFMKGLFAWIGYRSVAVVYDRAPRHAGGTTWNYRQLWNLAVEGITSFTVVPLKVATYLGMSVALFALIFGGQLIVRTIVYGNSVAGYPSLMAVVLFLGGVQLMTVGVIGEYLGRVFNETKSRPLYFVDEYIPSDSGVCDSEARGRGDL